MPVSAIKPFDLDIRYQHWFSSTVSPSNAQAERFPHCAVAAIAPDQKLGSHYFTG